MVLLSIYLGYLNFLSELFYNVQSVGLLYVSILLSYGFDNIVSIVFHFIFPTVSWRIEIKLIDYEFLQGRNCILNLTVPIASITVI